MKKRIFNSDVIFGIIALLASIYFIVEGKKFPGTTPNGVPGSGFFPTIAAGGVIVLSVLLIIQGIRKPQSYFNLTKEQIRNLIQMLIVFVVLAAFLVLWRFIPFLPAALLYVFALSRVLKQPLKYSIIYTIIVVLALYLIFSVAFKVNLNIC